MPTQRPTAKQQQVLDFIIEFKKLNGFSPTFREIGGYIGVSVGGVESLLNGLEGRGFITRNLSEGRSIQLVGAK